MVPVAPAYERIAEMIGSKMQIEDPDDVKVTLAMTMTMYQWRRAHAALEGGRGDLYHQVNDLIQKIETAVFSCPVEVEP